MALSIAVTPAGFDNIGEVLKQMKYNFNNIPEQALTQPKTLSGYDVVFINCSGSCNDWAQKAAPALRAYVEQGGSLYCSDYASDYLAAAFPQQIIFAGKQGHKGSVKAEVVDVGLRGLIGEQLPLQFDMGGWETIQSVATDAEVYLSRGKGEPLLVTFRQGDGEVIYTCFHNRAQPSKKEQQLLQFLVLKPLLARAKSSISQFVVGKSAGTIENIGVLDSGQESDNYEFIAKETQDLRFILTWEGDGAEFTLYVYPPSGEQIRKSSAITPPVEIEVPDATPGKWRYRVRAITVPGHNFPYVLMAGPATQIRVVDPSFWENLGQRTAAVSIDSTLLDAIEIEEIDTTPTLIDDIEIEFFDDE